MVPPLAALERMQTKTGDIHALRAGASIEGGENPQEFWCVPLGNSRRSALLVELPQATMPKCLDHRQTVWCLSTTVNPEERSTEATSWTTALGLRSPVPRPSGDHPCHRIAEPRGLVSRGNGRDPSGAPPLSRAVAGSQPFADVVLSCRWNAAPCTGSGPVEARATLATFTWIRGRRCGAATGAQGCHLQPSRFEPLLRSSEGRFSISEIAGGACPAGHRRYSGSISPPPPPARRLLRRSGTPSSA